MINRCMALLVEGIPDPLAEELTLGALWDDLCRLSGEAPPAAVRRMLEGESPASGAVLAHAPHPHIGTSGSSRR